MTLPSLLLLRHFLLSSSRSSCTRIRALHSNTTTTAGTITTPLADALPPTDGVQAETRRLRRLAVGGLGGANSEAIDPAAIVGSTLPQQHQRRGLPFSSEQKMATEQEVITGAAEADTTTAEWLPNKTPRREKGGGGARAHA
jgi:hypothetical protein